MIQWSWLPTVKPYSPDTLKAVKQTHTHRMEKALIQLSLNLNNCIWTFLVPSLQGLNTMDNLFLENWLHLRIEIHKLLEPGTGIQPAQLLVYINKNERNWKYKYYDVCYRSAVDGILLAVCCHHRCDWGSYVGKEFMKDCGITPTQFMLLANMTSWATCNSPHVKQGKSSYNPLL